MHKIIFTFIISFLFISCSALSPSLKTPNPKFSIPNECKDCDNALNFNKDWWLLFNDKDLNTLVEQALKNNSDIKLSLINYEKAIASLGINRSSLLPKLNASGGATKAKTNTKINNNFNLGLNLNYELDLWGKYRDNYFASSKALDASIYDFESTRLSMISTLVKLYFNSINLYNQELILSQTLKDYQKNYNLKQEQFKVGAISEYELYSYKAQLDNAKVSIENIKLQKDNIDKAILILIGANYDDILYKKLSFSKIKDYDITIPKGISSKILLLRPDIAAALARLEQKNYLVGAARADFLPNISLTGLLGFASPTLNNLFSNQTWSGAASGILPIFRWGEISYNVDLAKLAKDEAYINYENILKTTFGEVRTALLAYENANNNEKNYKDILNSQEKIYILAQLKYENGSISLNDLLSTKTNYLNAKLNFENAIYTKISAIIDTIKAFGGGFDTKNTNIQKDIEKIDMNFR